MVDVFRLKSTAVHRRVSKVSTSSAYSASGRERRKLAGCKQSFPFLSFLRKDREIINARARARMLWGSRVGHLFHNQQLSNRRHCTRQRLLTEMLDRKCSATGLWHLCGGSSSSRWEKVSGRDLVCVRACAYTCIRRYECLTPHTAYDRSNRGGWATTTADRAEAHIIIHPAVTYIGGRECVGCARTYVPNPDCIVALANEKVASFAIPWRGGTLLGNTETHVLIEGATRGSSHDSGFAKR